MTFHNEANKEDIAKTVLMPGDPLRAKYIADNFLEDAKLVNTVRNMFGYTGFYKGKKITVFASGMGMPSVGIYSYELFKFYDVDNIIRIGSCGVYSSKLNIFDTLLVENSYTEGNYAFELTGKESHLISSNSDLNSIIENTSKEINIPIIKVNALCSDCFDYYVDDIPALVNRLPKDLNITAAEMEAFALFYNANHLGKRASCLLTVVDSHAKNYIKKEVTADERQNSLNSMIKVALEAAIKL